MTFFRTCGLIAAIAVAALMPNLAMAAVPTDYVAASPHDAGCASVLNTAMPIELMEAPAGQCDLAIAQATGLCLARVPAGARTDGPTFVALFDNPACTNAPFRKPPG